MKRTAQTTKAEPEDLVQRKLSMTLCGPKIAIQDARNAALSLAQAIEPPSVLEFIAQPYFEAPGATLCQTTVRQPIISSPTALFAGLKLSVADVPDRWMSAYADWIVRLQRAHEFTTATLHLECGSGQAPTVEDPVVAGLLLYLSSASVETTTRLQWLEAAVGSPVGSWLAAEGLHTADDRQRILHGVQSDSRLLWSVSQIAGFGPAAAALATAHLDWHAGLVLATNGSAEIFERWLRTVCLAGCERADAACAALVLQPNADETDRTCWLSTLKNPKHARHAYEAVRWSRHTWPSERWNQFKNELRETATRDRGQWLANWFISIEPEHAASALGCEGLDELWGCEIIAALGSRVEDWAFRFQLGERLDLTQSTPASLALAWLNQRPKSDGTAA